MEYLFAEALVDKISPKINETTFGRKARMSQALTRIKKKSEYYNYCFLCVTDESSIFM